MGARAVRRSSDAPKPRAHAGKARRSLANPRDLGGRSPLKTPTQIVLGGDFDSPPKTPIGISPPTNGGFPENTYSA